jgi:ubiquinone/menaquinone biosynthesis C-methylase UbiE
LGNITLTVDFLGKFFEEYPEYFRAGKIAEKPYTPELSKAVSQTTKNIYLAFFFMIFPKNEHLTKMLEHGIKFLDIGCGSGSLIIKLAQAFKNSTFVGVDPDPYGIEEAGNIISEVKLGKQVSVKNIGGGDLPYNNEFDIASMVVTLHEILPEIRLKVVEKVYQALKSDGKLLILDFPYPDKLQEFRNPMHDFAILDQFFEVCGGFVHLNMVEQNEMLTKVGFKDIQRMPIGKGMFELITAVK